MGGGLKAVVMLDGERFEGVRALAGDDEGTSVNAGFEGIEAGNGLAALSAGAGRVLGVSAIRLDLEDGRHNFCFEGSRRGDGRRADAEWKLFRI